MGSIGDHAVFSTFYLFDMNYISFRNEFLPLILSGAKTQTRRLMKQQPSDYKRKSEHPNPNAKKFHDAPYFDVYNKGIFWCWWDEYNRQGEDWIECPFGMVGDIIEIRDAETRLKIEEIRVEKVKIITELDAVAEGFVSDWDDAGFSAINSFAEVWDDIYGEGSFDTDPYVWVIVFSRC